METKKETIWKKLSNFFKGKTEEEQIQVILNSPNLLNKIYFKVLEMQEKNKPKNYIG